MTDETSCRAATSRCAREQAAPSASPMPCGRNPRRPGQVSGLRIRGAAEPPAPMEGRNTNATMSDTQHDLSAAVPHCSCPCHQESPPAVPPVPEHLRMSLTSVGGGVLLRLEGELDIAGAPALTAVLTRCLEQTDGITVDATRLTFIDAAGIRPLADAQAASRRQGRNFCLAAASAAVRRVVVLAGLADRLLGTVNARFRRPH